MDKERTKINPSFQIRSKRGISSKHKTPSKIGSSSKMHLSKLNGGNSKSPSTLLSANRENICYNPSLKKQNFADVSFSEDIAKDNVRANVNKQVTAAGSYSTYKKSAANDPLELGYDANKELLEKYEKHINQQEDNIAKLTTHIRRLDALHNPEPSSALLSLRSELADVRISLNEAETIITGEKHLVAALHHDNTRLKAQLLEVQQRACCLQLLSDISEERLQQMLSSEAVRRMLPEQLQLLQRRLWENADEDTICGKVSPEAVLSLQHRLRAAEAALTQCQHDAAEERSTAAEELELVRQERRLDQERLEAEICCAEKSAAESRREVRAITLRCARLTAECEQQRRRHLTERGALLRTLARLGGAERLRNELEALDVSQSCLDAAEGHASASCQARELKLLTLQQQRELSEGQVLLQESQERCDALEREACLLRTAREEALAAVKKHRRSAVEQQRMSDRQQERHRQRARTEVRAVQAALAEQRQDLTRLVHMMYKLTVWQCDACPPDGAPPSPPPWVEGPRAVASLARLLQGGLDAAKARLEATRQRQQQQE